VLLQLSDSSDRRRRLLGAAVQEISLLVLPTARPVSPPAPACDCVISHAICLVLLVSAAHECISHPMKRAALCRCRAGCGIVAWPDMVVFLRVCIACICVSRRISAAPASIFWILRRVRVVSSCLWRLCDRRATLEPRGSGIVPRVRLSWYFSCIFLK
jgi:hypothetical protein